MKTYLPQQQGVQSRTIEQRKQATYQGTYIEDNRDTAQMRLMNAIQRIGMEEEEDLQMKPVTQLQSEDEEALQGKFETIQQKPNNTGLPDNLKSGVENMSGFSMDEVKVHYNSDKPSQLQAHAYTQGTDIHVAPRQEKHLPHEVWHVVQQMQGRVQPTTQMQGVNVNDNEGLESEADVMGVRAIQKNYPIGEKTKPIQSSENIQLKYNCHDREGYSILVGDGDDRYVIKTGGYENITPFLDELAGKFEFNTTNAEIVTWLDSKWVTIIQPAFSSAKTNLNVKEVLLMTKIEGVDLYKSNIQNASAVEIKKILLDFGKMLVMDLLTRNYDRFNLSEIKDRFGTSNDEKSSQEWSPWDGNGENVLIGADFSTTPIDSEFTHTDDEPKYAQEVATLLTSDIDILVANGMTILNNSILSTVTDEIKREFEGKFNGWFKEGIEKGIEILLTLTLHHNDV